jgi:two-component system invasion response regulator UvrY
MIRVVLADDHAIVRDGLRMVLEAMGDITVVGEAENGVETLKLLQQVKPHVLLLDVSMPGLNGFDVVQRLSQKGEQIPTLILSMYPEEQYALRFIKAGAAGYLAKDAASTQLVNAVRMVASGRKYISPEVASLLAETLSGEHDQAAHELLSDREYQVMCHIGSGKTVSQIAEQMSLSVRTISTYRSRILAKMRMSTNAELTHYTIKHGLV